MSNTTDEQLGLSGCKWVASESSTFLITDRMGSLLFLFLFLFSWELQNTRKSELWFSFFFSKTFFFKRLFYMIHTLKPGLCWVEYILSIRGLFLPTVSWNLAGGKLRNCGCLSWREGYPVPPLPGFSIWTCAFSELCFHRQNSVDISIFVLNLIIGTGGIFKQ